MCKYQTLSAAERMNKETMIKETMIKETGASDHQPDLSVTREARAR